MDAPIICQEGAPQILAAGAMTNQKLPAEMLPFARCGMVEYAIWRQLEGAQWHTFLAGNAAAEDGMTSVIHVQSLTDPISEVLGGFGERRAAYDDIFFKFNVPEIGIALLVDIIARRKGRRRIVEVRAALYTAEGATVAVEHYPASTLRRDRDGSIAIGNTWLGATGSRGAVGALNWDLVFGASGAVLDPQVAGAIRAFDLRLRSVPDVLMSGNVGHERHGYTFSHEPGMVGVSFGRRLPDHWYWISANAFQAPGVAFECMLLESRIFGLPFWHATVGYFHLRTPTNTITLLHPLTGQVRLQGDRTDFTVTARHRQDLITVHCAVPETRFLHLGDRIYTTLLGTCEIAGVSLAEGAAGLAEREAPRRDAARAR